MKLSHLTAFALATIIGATSLGSSAHAGLLGDIAGRAVGKALGVPNYGWMGNKQYMDCLRYVGAMNGNNYPGRDDNIRACKRQYLPGGR